MIAGLGSDYFAFIRHTQWTVFSSALLCALEMAQPIEDAWSELSRLLPLLLYPLMVTAQESLAIYSRKAPLSGFASLIVAEFPAIFTEFHWKRFTPLWRGSRDGFRDREIWWRSLLFYLILTGKSHHVRTCADISIKILKIIDFPWILEEL
jgi:hypothetical protein